nr:GTP-binding protein [Brevibacterium luteolum]
MAPRDRHAQVHETTTVKLAGAVELDRLAQALSASGLVRAKGFARDAAGQWHEVQLAGGRVRLSPAVRGDAAPAQIVLIASGPGAAEALTHTADRLQALPEPAANSAI